MRTVSIQRLLRSLAFLVMALALPTIFIPTSATAQSGTGTISGVVTYTSGGPVVGELIKIMGATNGGQAHTGADGSYSMTNLPPGDYEVAPGYFTVPTVLNTGQSTKVTVSADQTATANFTEEPAGVIAGVVTDTSGAPVAGMCVGVSGISDGGETTTRSDGSYTVGNLGPGSHLMTWDCNNLPGLVIPPGTPVTVVALETTTVNMTMDLFGSISGVVFDPTSGAGVAGVCLDAVSVNANVSAVSGSRGSFTMSDVAPGTFTINMDPACADTQQSNYADTLSPSPVTVTSGSATGPIDLTLVDANSVAAPSTSFGVPVSSYGSPVTLATTSTSASKVTLTSGVVNSVVSIPEGALPSGSLISVYPVTHTAPIMAVLPKGETYISSIAVSWTVPKGGSKVAATPVSLTVQDPSILAGDKIYKLHSSGLVTVGKATANGSAVVKFSSDPVFVFTEAKSKRSIIPATVVASFTSKSAVLSSKDKATLSSLVRKLRKGAAITITSYASNNWNLAKSRAVAVASYLSSKVKVSVTSNVVTNAAINDVLVTPTKY